MGPTPAHKIERSIHASGLCAARWLQNLSSIACIYLNKPAFAHSQGQKDGELGARDFRDFSRLPPAEANRAQPADPAHREIRDRIAVTRGGTRPDADR
jgi:hypothetical protein